MDLCSNLKNYNSKMYFCYSVFYEFVNKSFGQNILFSPSNSIIILVWVFKNNKVCEEVRSSFWHRFLTEWSEVFVLTQAFSISSVYRCICLPHDEGLTPLLIGMTFWINIRPNWFKGGATWMKWIWCSYLPLISK